MFILIVSAINAIGILALPRDLAISVGPDGWAALIGGHILSAAAVFFIVKLALLYPDETFVEYTPRILGKFLAIPLIFIVGVFWALTAARIVRQFADFIQLILPQTPIETIIITMLLVSAYIVRHGIEPIARVNEILFPVFITLLGLLILGALFEADFFNLLPLLYSSPKKLAVESISTSLGLEGQETIIMLLPFMIIPKKAYKAAFGALAFNLALRLALFVVCISLFGVELTKTLVWPVEELTRSITIGGTVLSRFDSIFIALWVSVTFTSIIIFHYLSSLTLSRLMKFREPSITVLPLVPVMFFASLIPESIVATEDITSYLSIFIGIFTFTVPPLLLLVSFIRGTYKNTEEERLGGR